MEMSRDEMADLISFALDQIDWNNFPTDHYKDKFSLALQWLEDESNCDNYGEWWASLQQWSHSGWLLDA